MLDDRRAHQCHRPGCDSAAVWRMKVTLIYVGNFGTRIEIPAECSVRTCDRHRETARDWMLEPRRRDLICAGLARHGIPAPSFELTRIEFLPVHLLAA